MMTPEQILDGVLVDFSAFVARYNVAPNTLYL